MGIDYTRKETDAIARAWRLTMYCASSDHSAERVLREAEKYECKGRSSLHAARVCILMGLFNLQQDGSDRREQPTTVYLQGLSSGIALAGLTSEYWRGAHGAGPGQFVRDHYVQALEAARLAVQCHSGARDRSLGGVK